MLLAVLAAHLALKLWLDDVLVGWGSGSREAIQRIDVAFVRELAPAAPPAAPPAVVPRAAPPRKPRAKAVKPPPAASAPVVEEAAVAAVVEAAASAPPPEPARPPAPEPVAVAASAPEPLAAASAPAPPAAASAPAATAFEWPPSTRLSYKLTGNYRGEVNGSARVQWVRDGSRYQVHLDVVIGPSFAPLISRRMTSDGELSDSGLVPRRYDETTRLPFQQPRQASLQFTPEQVTLANGSLRDALPGVQDPASQFVQLTWLFTTQPQLLRTGNAITLPLALPRRTDRWIYDVLEAERLDTPLGPLEAFPLKPRRADERPRGELSAEVWFAPTLQYLPVRLRIRQDAENYVDLVIDAAPLQAAPGR